MGISCECQEGAVKVVCGRVCGAVALAVRGPYKAGLSGSLYVPSMVLGVFQYGSIAFLPAHAVFFALAQCNQRMCSRRRGAAFPGRMRFGGFLIFLVFYAASIVSVLPDC